MLTLFNMKKKKIFLLVLLAVFVITASGCGIIDRILSFREEAPANVNETVEPPQETQAPVDEIENVDETTTVTLFFANPDGTGLVEEQRTIPKVVGIARATINELIAGPAAESRLTPTMPEGTILKDINIKENGLCIVDFSKELVDNHLGGSTEETLTVYSIVNTLTQFPTVKEVQILVGGQYVDTIAGHVDVSQALARDSSIITE